MTYNCENCGDTGYLTAMDGSDLGICTCAAGAGDLFRLDFVEPEEAQKEVPDAERRMFTPDDEEQDTDPDQFELEF